MTKRELADFGELLAGEETLLDGLSSGEFVAIGGDSVPSSGAGENRQIRGPFLRYLLLGGCAALKKRGCHLHEKGVRVEGALITDVLDLEGCTLPHDIALMDCRIRQTPNLRSAKIENLFLDGSILPGIGADGLTAKGDVFLRDVTSTGELRLLGATLGGDLVCNGATLTAGETGFALSADRLAVKGNVVLQDVTSTGELRLLAATLGSDLDCTGAALTAGETGVALSASGAKISGAFFLRNGAKIKGVLDLTAARMDNICDDYTCWPAAGNLMLNRCQYGAFTGGAISGAERIKWLGLQNPAQFGADFWPQPYEHCAKVLREMGHREDATMVLVEKEKLQRADRRRRLWRSYMREDYYWFTVWDWVMAVTVRYGLRPLLAFGWLFGFWLIGALVFLAAAQRDAIKPNDVRILRSVEWVACAPDYKASDDVEMTKRNQTGETQLACFLHQPEARSYPKFNPWIYSADTLLPIVALEMQSFWIPDDRDRGVGMWARRFLWLQIISGWALSLLAVAGFSGLIKSD